MTEIELETLGRKGRVAVIAPHPDDEVFAIGGLMTLLSWAGYELEVIAVTDGEASHAASERITPVQLRDIRCQETDRAYQQLEITPQRYRLGLPDSDVASHSQALAQMLEIHCADAAFIFAPLETDGHPDHDALGRVSAKVAHRHGVPLWRYAVWARLHPQRVVQGEPDHIRLPAEVLARKRRATSEYRSQLFALGPDVRDGPVLPEGFLDFFTQEEEFLWRAN